VLQVPGEGASQVLLSQQGEPRQPMGAVAEEVRIVGLAMLELATTALVNDESPTGDWTVDIGASHHICNDEDSFTRVHQAISNRCFFQLLTERGSEQLRLSQPFFTSRGPRGGTPLTVHSLFVLPGMAMSLFSERKATLRGFRTVFKADRLLVRDTARSVLMTGYTGGIYAFKTGGYHGGHAGVAVDTVTDRTVGWAKGAPTAPVAASVWHQWLSDAGLDSRMRAHAADRGMNMTFLSLEELPGGPCGSCMLKKMVWEP